MISVQRSDGAAYVSLTLFYYSLGQLNIDPEPYLISSSQVLTPREILEWTHSLSLTLLSAHDKMGHLSYVRDINRRLRSWGELGYEIKGV